MRWVWEALVAGGSPNSSNGGDMDEFPARGLSQTPGQAGQQQPPIVWGGLSLGFGGIEARVLDLSPK